MAACGMQWLPADFPAAMRPRRAKTATPRPPLDLEQSFPDVFERAPESEAPFEPPLPGMPPLPPPFTPDDPGNDVTEAHETTEPQESDAHDIEVPLPVSNYRLPDARVLQRGTRPTGKDLDVERVGASLLAALTEHGVEARLIGSRNSVPMPRSGS